MLRGALTLLTAASLNIYRSWFVSESSGCLCGRSFISIAGAESCAPHFSSSMFYWLGSGANTGYGDCASWLKYRLTASLSFDIFWGCSSALLIYFLEAGLDWAACWDRGSHTIYSAASWDDIEDVKMDTTDSASVGFHDTSRDWERSENRAVTSWPLAFPIEVGWLRRR